MSESEVSIRSAGPDLAATWSYLDDCGAGLVLLHPSDDGSRRQFLFEDLATRLPRLGVSVLRYDRRRGVAGGDVPYQGQVDDLTSALGWYRERLGSAPVGLWGFSQGAWIAMMAAASDPSIAFLILVGASAVSPAHQMRFGTAEQLRRAGYGAAELAELTQLRTTWEQYQRAQIPRREAQRHIDKVTARPWFPLSWVPADISTEPDWVDMDFNPGDVIDQIHCPVLVFYGEDEWIPVADSIDIWQERLPDPRLLTIRRLPNAGHHPTLNASRTIKTIDPGYIRALDSWLREQLTSRARG